jgi:hypothetical protein
MLGLRANLDAGGRGSHKETLKDRLRLNNSRVNRHLVSVPAPPLLSGQQGPR